MRGIVPLALVLALVPSALAASARERLAAGPLSTVTITGTEVAYVDEYRTGCHEIRVWDVADFGHRRYASHCLAATSTGSGVAGVIVSERRALWLTYTGGNIREWSLWTKVPWGRAKRIAFLTADVDGPPPIILGRAWEGSLPYAMGSRVVVLARNGSRRFTLTAPARVVSLSAHSRGYALVLASGTVQTVSLDGKPLSEFPYEAGFVQEAVLSSPGLIAKTPGGLEIHRGGPIRKVSLPQGSRFLGFAGGLVAYGTGRQLRLMHLDGSHDTLYRTLAPRFHAQLGRRGIAYGSGRKLGFSAWVTIV